MVELVLTRKAERFYRQANPDLAQRLNRCFDQLCQDPYTSANVKALKGAFAGCFRYRMGDWRIIYKVELANQAEPSDLEQNGEKILVVTVLLIAHRREAYR